MNEPQPGLVSLPMQPVGPRAYTIPFGGKEPQLSCADTIDSRIGSAKGARGNSTAKVGRRGRAQALCGSPIHQLPPPHPMENALPEHASAP